MATAVGLDEGQIERTTLVHFRRLERGWKRSPPVHVIAAGYIGYDPSKGDGTKALPCARISPSIGDFPDLTAAARAAERARKGSENKLRAGDIDLAGLSMLMQ